MTRDAGGKTDAQNWNVDKWWRRQALNAAMRGVVKGLFQARKDVEIYGFEEGYKGLIYSNFRMLKAEDFSGILTVGGTTLELQDSRSN